MLVYFSDKLYLELRLNYIWILNCKRHKKDLFSVFYFNNIFTHLQGEICYSSFKLCTQERGRENEKRGQKRQSKESIDGEAGTYINYGLWNVVFNYLSIPQYSGSWGNRFQETQGSQIIFNLRPVRSIHYTYLFNF